MSKTHANVDNSVELAGRKFVIERIPMAKVKEIGGIIGKLNLEVGDVGTSLSQEKVVSIVEKALEFPHAILSIFIKKLPVEIFTDEEEGVTFPEFFEAFDKALTINRLDALKNVYTRFLQQGR